MKNKKLCGFFYDKNIANFEAFCQDKNFSKNFLFLGSDYIHTLEGEKGAARIHKNPVVPI